MSAARDLALFAVAMPSPCARDHLWSGPNMILSLSARPPRPRATSEIQDGMPFGTRGGMSVEHNFPADGEYVLSIGDMAWRAPYPTWSSRTPCWRCSMARNSGARFRGEDDHKGVDQRSTTPSPTQRAPEGHPLHATPAAHRSRDVPASQLRGATMTAAHRPDTRTTAAASIPWKRQPARAGRARHPHQGPREDHRHDDSPSRRKIFICKPSSVADEPACARTIVENLRARPSAARDR